MPSGQRLQTYPGGFGSPFGLVVSLLCKPVRDLFVVGLPSDLWYRCYASRTAVSSVPGVFWFCPPICGVAVMPAGQRLQTCPLPFYLLWPCPRVCGVVVVMPSGQWFQTCPGEFGSALEFVVSLLCKPDSGFKRARGFWPCPPVCGVVVMQSGARFLVLPSDLYCFCYASRILVSNVPGGFWLCPPVCGVVVMQSGKRLQKWPCFWSCPPICVVSVMPAGQRLKPCMFLPSDLWCGCYASKTTASNVPGMSTIAVALSSEWWCRCCAKSRKAV